MAVKTKQQIIDDATALIPDNTNHEVSPADIRQRIIDVVDSSLFTEELPDFATVATTGSYDDLTNKPTYATVANTGSYNDLTNKPVYANVATTGQYVDLINRPALATVATSGAYSDLTGKPTLGTASSANSADFAPNTAVMPTRTITASTGLTGGGTLSTDRTIALNANTVASLAKADSAVLYANTQTLTPAEQGQARANIGVSVLTGFRNKIINGDFDIWQRGSSQTTAGYKSDDRWINYHLGTTGSFSHAVGTFASGQTDVPGNPRYYSKTTVTHAVAVDNGHVKEQRIENLAQFSGRWITVTFYAKADSNKNIAVELSQNYGTGGSPSATVSMPCGMFPVTTSWQKITVYTQIPNMTGKTFGTNNEHNLGVLIWFDAGSNFTTRASGLGQQSGIFDIAHVSVVFDDARNETDPFSPRHIQQEYELCQRYYCAIPSKAGYGISLANGALCNAVLIQWPVQMRSTPTTTISYGYRFGTSGFRNGILEGISADGAYGYVQADTNAQTSDFSYSIVADAEL